MDNNTHKISQEYFNEAFCEGMVEVYTDNVRLKTFLGLKNGPCKASLIIYRKKLNCYDKIACQESNS